MEKLKPLEHKIKQLFFRALKSTLTKRTGAENRVLDGSLMKRVIIFRPDRIGDMLITLPLVDGLKQFFPHLKVSILASPKNYELIRDDKRFDEIFIYSKNFWRDTGVIRLIRKKKFDCIIDTVFEDSVTTLFFSHFCAAGSPIIGMGKTKYAGYYNFNCDNSGGHIINNTLKLLSAFGIDPNKVSGYAQPHLSQSVLERAVEFIKPLTSSVSCPVKIGINLSSGAPTRVWQRGKWIELVIKILSSHSEANIILITMPSDRKFAQEIIELFGERVHIVPDELNIAGVSAIIKHLDVLITPDTSLVHIARAFQVPVVGLYTRNARNFNLWHPFGMKSNVVNAQHEDNIFDITVEQVSNILSKTIGSRQEVSQ